MISLPRPDAEGFFRNVRAKAYDDFNPARLGYRCDHSVDLFEEVATIGEIIGMHF